MKKKFKFEVVVELTSELAHIDKKELNELEERVRKNIKDVWGSGQHNFHYFSYETVLVKNIKKLK